MFRHFFPDLFYLGTAWGPSSVNIEGSFLSLKEQQCLISQAAGTPALILDVQGSSQGSHQYFPNWSGKPQALAWLPAATCQICSFLSTVSPLCSSVFASKCFPGTILLSNRGPSGEEKVLFFIRNFKSCMYFMNVELCAAGCCLAGGITFLLNPRRFQASKFSHLFSFNKFSPLCTQGQLWWHHSSTYTFSLSVALLEAIYSIIL